MSPSSSLLLGCCLILVDYSLITLRHKIDDQTELATKVSKSSRRRICSHAGHALLSQADSCHMQCHENIQRLGPRRACQRDIDPKIINCTPGTMHPLQLSHTHKARNAPSFLKMPVAVASSFSPPSGCTCTTCFLFTEPQWQRSLMPTIYGTLNYSHAGHHCLHVKHFWSRSRSSS